MGLFEDLSRSLETRLEEFLRSNPHLELLALDDEVREQEQATQRLMLELQQQEKRFQDEILETAKEVQLWHMRIQKAKNANRLDLAQPAQEREAALLRQGNQSWSKMQLVKERLKQTEELQRKVQQRRQEVQAKLSQAQAERANPSPDQRSQTTGWNQSQSHTTRTPSAKDPLDAKFQQWEMDEELDQLKRNIRQ